MKSQIIPCKNFVLFNQCKYVNFNWQEIGLKCDRCHFCNYMEYVVFLGLIELLGIHKIMETKDKSTKTAYIISVPFRIVEFLKSSTKASNPSDLMSWPWQWIFPGPLDSTYFYSCYVVVLSGLRCELNTKKDFALTFFQQTMTRW